MQAQFKASVVIDGHRFMINQNGLPKTYTVPKNVAKHEHFKRYVKHGTIVIGDGDELADPVQESVEERNKRLSAKIMATRLGSNNVQTVESDPVDEETSVDEADEEMVEDEDFGDEAELAPEKAKAKSKKKTKRK